MQQSIKEKVRVYAFAKMLDVESKIILDFCKDLGYESVKNQLSSLDPEQCDIIKQRLAKPAAASPSAPAAAARPAVNLPTKPLPEKKMLNLSTPRPRPVTPSAPVAEVSQAEMPEPVAPVVAEEVVVRPEPKPVPLVVETPVVETPVVKAVPVIEMPVPAAELPKAPVAEEVKPAPVVVEKPAPVVAEKPVPVVVEKPTPVAEPVVVDKPTPVVVEKPTPVVEVAPAKVTPAPVVVAPPVAVTPPAPVATAAPAPEPVKPAVPAVPAPPGFKPKMPSKMLNLNSRPSGPRPGARPAPTPVVAPEPVAEAPSEVPAEVVAPVAVVTTAPVAPPVVVPPTPVAASPAQPTVNPATRPNPAAPANPSRFAGGSQGGSPQRTDRFAGPRPGMSGNPPRPGGGVPGGGTLRTGGQTGSPRPGLTPTTPQGQRPAGGNPPAGGPNQGNQGGQRTDRRFDRDRRTAQPGAGPRTGPPPAGQKPGTPPGPNDRRTPGGAPPPPPPPAAPRRFTPEELEALRSGRSVTDVLKKAAAPTTPAPDAPPEDELSEEDRKNGAPGKKKPGEVAGRDDRHKQRAERAEKRKTRSDSIIVQGGRVELVEDAHGSRHGRRPRHGMLRKKPTEERKGKIPITLPISVRSFSEAIGMKVAELVFKLKDLTNSLFTINSTIEREVAELIASEKGCELDIRAKQDNEGILRDQQNAADEADKMEPRAPVVTIMGHVDHGKTSLLDRIRSSKVVDTEAGGITQVIRAWRVEGNGKPVTFLDTPGHEAFTKMRARGANVTDIAVIVVAVDAGVKPQTEEAIAHAKAAGVSIVVALNKIDMPGADIRKTESQLYTLGLLPDTMGGDVPFVRTSAMTGEGIDELLETLALVAELKELKANPHKPAFGTCLEAHLSGDQGVMATLLVQQGTLHKGDIVLCGSSYGRVRAMYDDFNRPLKDAPPSMPVRITGLDAVPRADDQFHVVTDLSKAREMAEKRRGRDVDNAVWVREAVSLESIGKVKVPVSELKIILKAEARGSIEAIQKEMSRLVHEEVRVRVLHAGIGAITESDVHLALASPEDSIVVGFNVVPDDNALKLAGERGVTIREYNIIYNLTDDIKAALEGKLKPREEVIHLGRAVIREVFKVSRTGSIAGCYVTSGTIERSAKVRVIREGAVVFPPPERTASLESLRRFKDDVREVREGYDCGMKVLGYDDIKVGDVIEAYRIELVQRKL